MENMESIEKVNIQVEIELDLLAVKKEPECENETEVVIKKEPEYPADIIVKQEPESAMYIKVEVNEGPLNDTENFSNLDDDKNESLASLTSSTSRQPLTRKDKCERDISHRCYICQKTFTSIYLLFSHKCTPEKEIQHVNTRKKTLPCDVCKLKFKYQETLNEHRLQHFEGIFPCTLCKEKFGNEIDLNSHLADIHKVGHKEDKQLSYTCQKCQRRFWSERNLAQHQVTHLTKHDVTQEKQNNSHRAENKPLICEICQKLFIVKASLKRHMRNHAQPQTYLCDICQKQMAYKSSLIKHMQLHMPQKKYPCDICQKRFAQPSTMKSHRMTHTGEKPHSCDHCQMRFSDKSNLKKHKLIHMDTKPYSCKVCKKQYTDNRSLVGHMRSHTGEKPFSCERCKKGFAYLCALTRHKRSQACKLRGKLMSSSARKRTLGSEAAAEDSEDATRKRSDERGREKSHTCQK